MKASLTLIPVWCLLLSACAVESDMAYYDESELGQTEQASSWIPEYDEAGSIFSPFIIPLVEDNYPYEEPTGTPGQATQEAAIDACIGAMDACVRAAYQAADDAFGADNSCDHLEDQAWYDCLSALRDQYLAAAATAAAACEATCDGCMGGAIGIPVPAGGFDGCNPTNIGFWEGQLALPHPVWGDGSYSY